MPGYLLMGALLLFAAPDERAARWRQDLEVVQATLSAKGTSVDFKRGISTRGQKDFARLYPHFDADLAALEESVPSLTDREVALGLMKIIASANVAHNTVQVPPELGFNRRLPLELTWYSDGLAVTAASREYAATLGARIETIAGKKPEELMADLAPYIAHESDAGLKDGASRLLRNLAALEHVGALAADGRVAFEMVGSNGGPLRAFVAPEPLDTPLIPLAQALDLPVTLTRSHGHQNYWRQYLPDSGTLFIQYNACVQDPKESFSDFTTHVFQDADGHAVKRVIVDLRENGGGNSAVISPLLRGLKSRARRVGHIYVLIGPHTFSSALLNAIDLRAKLHATLVGEPTAAQASGYGEVKQVTLPNSKIVVRYSSKFFGTHKDAGLLTPDIAAPRTLADMVAGRDAAFQAALNAQ